MPKFFVPKENIFEDSIKITGSDVGHISKVLRMSVGDSLVLCDGKGMNYDAEITDISKEEVSCKVITKAKANSEANIRVTLFQGLPKASKMDYIIQKTCELGIFEICPIEMSRCVMKLDKKDAKKKVERWQKISQEASKQSGRGVIPEVLEPISFKEAVEQMKNFDLAFAPYECEDKVTIKDVLTESKDVQTVAFMIGPEGGYSQEETEYLLANGIKTVTLGKRILRTETAGEAVLSMVMYEIGDINII